MPNIPVKPITVSESMRKLAVGAWRSPNQPATFGKADIPIDHILDQLTAINRHRSIKIGFHHVFGKVLSEAIDQFPFLNRVLIRRSFYQRRVNRLFFQVMMKNGHHLDTSGVCLDDMASQPLDVIADSLHQKVTALKNGSDPDIRRIQRLISYLPFILMKPILYIMNLFLFTFNLSVFGIMNDRFGSAMISCVGSLGIHEAYLPLFPFSRCPLIFSLGKPQKKPVVTPDNEIKIQTIVTITLTFDHRYFDGAHIAKLTRFIQRRLRDLQISSI